MSRSLCVTEALASAMDRARRGGSGALSPASRSSRAEFPFEGLRLSGSVRRTEASMAGSHAASAREPGQIREEAALSDTARAPWSSLAGAEDRRARPRSSHRDGCTVRFGFVLSQEALDIVRKSAERWNAGDFEGMLELYSDDLVVVTGEHWPEANVTTQG